MSKNTQDPTGSAPSDATSSSRRESPVTSHKSGRVKHDERGNAIWEWAMNTGALVVESATQKLKKLDNPTLSLVDDVLPPRPAPEAAHSNPIGVVEGYSPYDSGLLDKQDAPRKKDLRKLGEWLKLKKQAESLKSGKT
jgi:hypothetical protein